MLIELVTYWDQGFGKYNWILWKNIPITIFAVVALIFGSKDAIKEIYKMYTATNK